MTLNKQDLFLLCQNAISAAFQGGHLISTYVEKNISSLHKSAGSSLASQVVTEVDFLSQELILQSLLPSCKIYNLALLAEENEDDFLRLEKDFFWCIDPLDGTLAFLESSSGFAVSIALVSRRGIPYIGVVYDPCAGNLYYAIKGQGAFRNGRPFIPVANKDILTLCFDRSFSEHKLFNICLKEIESLSLRLGLKGINVIYPGGAVMNACTVAENPRALYFKLPKPEEGGGCLWDFAATASIFSEIGSPVSDCLGNPLDLNLKESVFMNQKGVLYASDKEIQIELLGILEKSGF